MRRGPEMTEPPLGVVDGLEQPFVQWLPSMERWDEPNVCSALHQRNHIQQIEIILIDC